MNEEQELSKDQLIIAALRESVGRLTSEYEEKIADIRAEYTMLAQEFTRVTGLYDQLVLETSKVTPEE